MRHNQRMSAAHRIVDRSPPPLVDSIQIGPSLDHHLDTLQRPGTRSTDERRSTVYIAGLQRVVPVRRPERGGDACRRSRGGGARGRGGGAGGGGGGGEAR